MWLGWVMRDVGREGGREGGRVFDIIISYGEDRIWVGKVKKEGGQFAVAFYPKIFWREDYPVLQGMIAKPWHSMMIISIPFYPMAWKAFLVLKILKIVLPIYIQVQFKTVVSGVIPFYVPAFHLMTMLLVYNSIFYILVSYVHGSVLMKYYNIITNNDIIL